MPTIQRHITPPLCLLSISILAGIVTWLLHLTIIIPALCAITFIASLAWHACFSNGTPTSISTKA